MLKPADEIILNVGRRAIGSNIVVTQCCDVRPDVVVQINQLMKKTVVTQDLKSSKQDIKIKGIEGIKEFLLGLLLSCNKLNIINK